MLVGLGNPGAEYGATRHNVGFRFVDRLTRDCGVRMKRKWFHPAWVGSTERAGERLRLVKPRTFMNRSGLAVAPLARKWRVSVEDVIVVYDDVALDTGVLRLREKGGAGGHNGVQSLIDCLGSDAFMRIRIGIGGAPAGVAMVDHVLGAFTNEEEKSINAAIERGKDMLDCLLRDGPAKAMSVFNRKIN